MLGDLVLDTNVLLHAGDPRQGRQASAQKLFAKLKTTTTKACVDEGYDQDPARNRSLIGAEYMQHLRQGSVGYALIQFLAVNGRIAVLSRHAPAQIKKQISQMIRNVRDRTFLGVAYNSQSRLLVSHDFQDFDIGKRARLRRDMGVQVVEAQDCCALL
jgi:predicted nucleic acid-binding protein